ncbi:MAG: DMT family transporter [Alphaproteobacteria bacterium]|jgi:drug/metabolite transporter (DMT)-like permease|nr:DMT family transporter [Alphaproteobacteria bacterium]
MKAALQTIRRLGASNPYLLLTLTMLMWSANGIAGRVAIGEVSPMVIVTLRWLISCSLLFAFAFSRIREDWLVLKHHIVRLVLGAIFGFTGFNALFYLSAHHTSAVNMTILQGSLPIFVLMGAALFQRTPLTLLQAIGIPFTLAGVIAVASQGQLDVLLAFNFNIGDIGLVIACLSYAIYTLMLRNRPKVSGIGFFAIVAMAAFITSLPLLGLEMALGEAQWPTVEGWMIVAFIGICPSLLAQLFFLKAVELIGPGRAANFTNLVPIFGPLLAIILLGEPFHLYHAVALMLVLGGITLAEWRRA